MSNVIKWWSPSPPQKWSTFEFVMTSFWVNHASFFFQKFPKASAWFYLLKIFSVNIDTTFKLSYFSTITSRSSGPELVIEISSWIIQIGPHKLFVSILVNEKSFQMNIRVYKRTHQPNKSKWIVKKLTRFFTSLQT